MNYPMTNYLESAVMRRGRAVYYLRLVLTPFVLKPFFLAVLVTAIWFKVSVTDVFHNAWAIGEPASVYHFSASAFSQTELLVKVLIIGLVFLAGWLVIDFARKMPLVRARFWYSS